MTENRSYSYSDFRPETVSIHPRTKSNYYQILELCVVLCCVGILYRDTEISEENIIDREEQEMGRRGHRFVLPEDGYEWKKYGQKFIKNIGKFR